jgi:hypothetical protein
MSFNRVFGHFPVTTTAQGLRDPQRTRRLLQLAAENGPARVRFSILTLKMLDRFLAEFSPDELRHVDFVPLNRESLLQPISSGRARERNPTHSQRAAANALDNSISCVSGFLINMVEGSVKLISPCASNERWPDGYFVHAASTFTSGSDLKVVLDAMIDERMYEQLLQFQTLHFNSGLEYQRKANGFSVSTAFNEKCFEGFGVGEIGDRLHQDCLTMEELVCQLSSFVPLANDYVPAVIDVLYNQGIVNSDPS